jgi:ACT domain-containing protein
MYNPAMHGTNIKINVVTFEQRLAKQNRSSVTLTFKQKKGGIEIKIITIFPTVYLYGEE